jgi:hypothetical protein
MHNLVVLNFHFFAACKVGQTLGLRGALSPAVPILCSSKPSPGTLKFRYARDLRPWSEYWAPVVDTMCCEPVGHQLAA